MKEPMTIAIVIGIFLVLAAFIHGGRYTVATPGSAAGGNYVLVVDRFTGVGYVNGTKLVPLRY
jgi:hypothetical protein